MAGWSRLLETVCSIPLLGPAAWRLNAALARHRLHPLSSNGEEYVRRAYLRSRWIGSHDEGAVYLRHLKRQIRRNVSSLDLSAGLVLARFLEQECFFRARPGDHIESSVMLDRCWEPHILAVLKALIQHSEGSVVDVGANIGATTIPLACMFRTRQFDCFEPHPAVHQRLQDNIFLNRVTNVNANNLAVADVAGSADFFAQKGNRNMGLSSLRKNDDIQEHEIITVRTTTLDEYFGARDTTVSVIKIDVQGFELAVLEGARGILERDRPSVVFEFEDVNFASEAERRHAKDSLLQLFSQCGYDLFGVPDPRFSFMPRVTFEGEYSGDVVALPVGRFD